MNDTSSSPLVFVPLSSEVRRGLEAAVVEARGVVELGVGRVFDRLGIQREGDPLSSGVPVGLSDGERVLRRVVGVKVRAAGGFDAAVEEVAFSVWHRMLFARFLAENDLLMHPEHNVPVSLVECGELADEGLGADRWVVASKFAAEMLPGLFPTDDPLSQIGLLPEDLQALEAVLDGIPSEVFTSDDGLGWVYQFWQSRAKDKVNASEVKIGARELPAVTQLFTEHYMVRFLLENSLGAWWAARHSDSPLNASLEYLRFDDEGNPAAGSFEGWPDSVAEVTVMDPCCGSGHFLTALFEMLWRMRVEEEGLNPVVAQDRVLEENLFGLELDLRCTQIAAFNVALTAWKAGGYRQLPELNVACSGIRVAGSRDSWLELAEDDPRLRDGLERLHDVFKEADTLGSLIDPRRAVGDDSLLAADFDEIQPLLHKALEREKAEDPAAAVFGQQVAGVAKAANLLSRQYTLVATNPPFLGIGRMEERLSTWLELVFPSAKNELAAAFLLRCLHLAAPAGDAALVSPQNWLFLTTYKSLRDEMLGVHRIRSVAGLGAGAFESISGEVVQVVLIVSSFLRPLEESTISLIDVREAVSAEAKSTALISAGLTVRTVGEVRAAPDSRIVLGELETGHLLSEVADVSSGIQTGDAAQFVRCFWELSLPADGWEYHQSTPNSLRADLGLSHVLLWEDGKGRLLQSVAAKLGSGGVGAWIRGTHLHGQEGITVKLMQGLDAAPFQSRLFDNNVAVVTAKRSEDLPALRLFLESPDFGHAVRRIEPKMNVTPGTLVKVPFDVEHWRRVAEGRYPDGLPEPWSDDPTQWLFLGDSAESTHPLQVGVARLLGYSWPDQEPDELDALADDDGIVCLSAVQGELPAADRLRELLAAAFDTQGDPVSLIDGLLADADASGKSLGWWLENRFFKQHHQLFHKRPFIWHITDHHRGGFSALVNYHKLDRPGLERLAFTYLGWWIDKQRAAVIAELPGADDGLAAAETLQDKLKLILEGEPPYDIFVRWKSLAEQPIGWEPDLDDGVRLNIRPFVEAGVLKIKKPSGIKWGKDRGKNPDDSERLNDLHFTRAEKQAARNNQ